MQMAVYVAIALGVVLGVILCASFGKLITERVAKGAAMPRLVFTMAACGGLIALLPSCFLAFVVGGNFGGGWAEVATSALRLGSIGVPLGLAIGIAAVLAVGVLSGTLLGGLLGRGIAYVLPDTNRP